ncbi:Kelch repeat-containing protein [Deinococcus pimensis]|uniref:Kelch repeat-containing protein n=1 Tax=Deinococcus pimensis TaxID=309888 RepID=UPI000487AA96|nr:kelch repeat-containing protein [Deinococcus pimensis]
MALHAPHHRRAVRLLVTAALTAALLGACAQPQTTGQDRSDVTLRSWSRGPNAPAPRFEAQGAALGDRLYLLGGFDRMPTTDYRPLATTRADVLDPTSGTWSALPDLPVKLTHAAVTTDPSRGWIVLAGGFVGDHPGPSTADVLVYDTTTRTWSANVLPDLPAAVGGGALVRLDRQLHFFGGVPRANGEYGQDSSGHWTLDLDAPGEGWQARAPLPNPRNHMAGVVVGGLIYAVGGQHRGNETDGNQTSVDVYDPATDTWKGRADLPLPLSHTSDSTVVWEGRVLVVGGVTNGQKKVGGVLAYDPAANTWASVSTLPESAVRQSPIADVVQGRLVVTTGSDDAGPTATTWTAAP